MIYASFWHGPELRYRSFDSLDHLRTSLAALDVPEGRCSVWAGDYRNPQRPTKHGIDDLLNPPEVQHLKCLECGKQVSTGFIPEPTDTPDKGLVVRAWIVCPECVEKAFGEQARGARPRVGVCRNSGLAHNICGCAQCMGVAADPPATPESDRS